jgi:antitoxin component YwqK of YwqJK toxin-antitoxin module
MSKHNQVHFDELIHDEDGRMIFRGVPWTGIALEYWSDGPLASEISFRDGLLHGPTIGWHSNGFKSEEVHYDSGRAVGIRRQWHPNGVLKLEEEIGNDGFQLRLEEWDENAPSVVPSDVSASPADTDSGGVPSDVSAPPGDPDPGEGEA